MNKPIFQLSPYWESFIENCQHHEGIDNILVFTTDRKPLDIFDFPFHPDFQYK